jgi:hypothetical protein
MREKGKAGKRLGQQRGRVSAHRHESRVAQGELPGVSAQDI